MHMCGSFRSSCIIGLASSSSCINARSKIDKRVDKVNIVTQDSVQTLRQMAYVTVEDLYIGFGPFDLQTKLWWLLIQDLKSEDHDFQHAGTAG